MACYLGMNAPSKVRFGYINVFRSIARVAFNAAFEEISADDFAPLANRLLPQYGYADEYGGQILNGVTGIVRDKTRITPFSKALRLVVRRRTARAAKWTGREASP